MVDGALETLDLTLSKRGIVGFASSFFVDDSDSFSKFSFFEFFENFSRLGGKRLDRSGCEEKDSVTLDGNETSQNSFEVKSFDGLMFFAGKIQ